MSIENILKKYEDIALSDKEVLKLVNNKANLILYPNLYKYKNIDEILNPYGACIILYESKPSYGHWCLIFKVNDYMLEFFNPYGGWPDDSLKKINLNFRMVSNQYYPLLSYLMVDSPYKLSYNEYEFQKYGPDIKTCGRWCAIRLIYRFLTLNEFHNFINYFTNLFNISGDRFVTLLTLYINNN